VPEPPRRRGERYARALRHELGLGNGDNPVDIAGVIGRRDDVDVMARDFGAGGGDGVYLWDAARERGIIVVNAAKSLGRQRFVAAHELGHHEMDRFEATGVLIADEDVADLQGDPLEDAADAFAAYLLAPSEAILDRAPQGPDLQDARRLAADFALEPVAMIRRLREVGLIDRPREHALRAQLDGAPVAADVVPPPRATPLPSELPQALRDGALALFVRGSITEERLAGLLLTDLEGVRSTIEQAGMAGRRRIEPDAAALSDLLGD
jgi:Zn-dependent peptidase ImmA (M78 family)